jgi:septum site-determining protein MinC
MGEDIVFKGVRGELQIVLNEKADFNDIMEQLEAKLVSANDFFNKSTVVKLPLSLKPTEREQITELLAGHGLVCKVATPPKRHAVSKAAPAVSEQEGYEIKALVVPRTLRSGQKVTHDGSVVVVGDVNAGAQVVANGDIIIMGACRGVAHAGANGNHKAKITASKIVATQLRIAGLIARSPDDLDKPAYIETARIKDGTVVIEPANK